MIRCPYYPALARPTRSPLRHSSLIVGLAAGIPICTLIGISEIWRTTLLFAQLWRCGLFPLAGMRFLNDARGVRRALFLYIRKNVFVIMGWPGCG